MPNVIRMKSLILLEVTRVFFVRSRNKTNSVVLEPSLAKPNPYMW